jgi:hypothetical protein
MANILDQKLQDYVAELTDAEKKSVLLLLKTFLGRRSKQDNAIDIEEYNKEIDQALLEVEEGNYITQEEMEQQAAKW